MTIVSHMADFEGISLIGAGTAGGSLLFASTPADASGVARLSGDTEVEIRQGLSAVVVRGIKGSDYESVIALAPELANQGLDIFSMTGQARLALDDLWRTHAAWWPGREGIIIRSWCSATAVFAAEGTGVVRGPDGEVKLPDVEPPVPWQESMRYFRMSELTDDLFDAFRNIYLALESLLNFIEPIRLTRKGRPAEGEEEWFKRALRKAAGGVDLAQFTRTQATDPVREIYDELHNQIRNRVFHAKDVLQPFLPQNLIRRDQVMEAKVRYSRLFLALSGKAFGTRFPDGGLSFSTTAIQQTLEAVTKGWRVAVTSDPAPTDTAEQVISPKGEPHIVLPVSRFNDPRGDDFKALIARAPIDQVTVVMSAVGRVGSVDLNEQLGIIGSLGGRLSLTGLDRCEFVISVSMKGRQARKWLYAT